MLTAASSVSHHVVDSSETGTESSVVSAHAEPEEGFSSPVNDIQRTHWDEWWNNNTKGHGTYRLQGFKPGDVAGHYRNLSNGVKFKVRWTGNGELRTAVRKKCSTANTANTAKKNRDDGADGRPTKMAKPATPSQTPSLTSPICSEQVQELFDDDRLNSREDHRQVVVQAFDREGKSHWVDLKDATPRTEEFRAGRYGCREYTYLYNGYSFADNNIWRVERRTLTCKELGGELCAPCKGKRGLSKCKRARDVYIIDYDEGVVPPHGVTPQDISACISAPCRGTSGHTGTGRGVEKV
jgi:hypothetical protein